MTILTKDEILKMRAAGSLAAKTLNHVEKYIQPGVKTFEIDEIVKDFILTRGGVCAPLNYKGFPKSCCTSVNDVVCHGVPDNTVLKDGDIINVDVTAILDGFHGDTSRTFFVGEVSDEAKLITSVALEAMEKGIEAITPQGRTGDIGFVINKFVTRKGFYPVKEIGGHGIGKKFHEDPFVPSFGKKGKGDVLVPNHCITVEPMVNMNSSEFKEFDIPGSSIKYYRTLDGSLSAQFEHTVLVHDGGYEILTVD